MKRIVIIIGILISIGFTSQSFAQNINININLDKQPAWGPTGYDYAGYYYIPELNIYYDVANTLFYYLNGSKWTSARYLPDKYRRYDLYNMYKIVINDNQPWLQNKTHKKSYSQYKNDRTQEPIRYSNNSKYSNSKNNTINWVNTNSSSRNSGRSTSTSNNSNSGRSNTQSNNGRGSQQNNNARR